MAAVASQPFDVLLIGEKVVVDLSSVLIIAGIGFIWRKYHKVRDNLKAILELPAENMAWRKHHQAAQDEHFDRLEKAQAETSLHVQKIEDEQKLQSEKFTKALEQSTNVTRKALGAAEKANKAAGRASKAAEQATIAAVESTKANERLAGEVEKVGMRIDQLSAQS